MLVVMVEVMVVAKVKTVVAIVDIIIIMEVEECRW